MQSMDVSTVVSELASESGSLSPFEASEKTPLLTNGKLSLDTKAETSAKHRSKWTKEQKSLIISLSILQCFAYCCLSILAPFFPYEAAKKGMSSTTAGFVFSCFALTQVIVSPIAGKFLVPMAGPRFVILIGSLFSGSCCILFGILAEIEDLFQFTIMTFIVRIFEAIGIACYSTAALSFIVRLFPRDFGVVLGITEISLGVGRTMGPALGSALYSVGGYKLPFVVLGSILLLSAALNMYLLPSNSFGAKELQKPALLPILTSFYPVFCLSVAMTLTISTSFIAPTLEPHLAEIGLTPSQTGLMFILTTATYSLLTPFVGRYSDLHPALRPHILCLGLALIGIAFLIMGPSPIFRQLLDNTLASNIVGLITLGIGVGFIAVPSFQVVMKSVLEIGYENNLPTHSAVSGLYTTAFSLGDTIGPSIGGALFEYFGYSVASSVVALISFTVCISLALVSFCRRPPLGTVTSNFS